MTNDQATSCLVVSPNVLHETIEGEVMVIDLGTGSYYSLRGSAADVWQLVQEFPGVTDTELIEALARADEGSRAAIETSVPELVGQLRDEGLLAESPGSQALRASAQVSRNGASRSFTAPVVEKYTDMQDLVLLDPVHQVDSAGWPALPPEEAAKRRTA